MAGFPSSGPPNIVDGGIHIDKRTTGQGLIQEIIGQKIYDGGHSITIRGWLGPPLPATVFVVPMEANGVLTVVSCRKRKVIVL